MSQTLICSCTRLYADHHGWLVAWLRRRLGGCTQSAEDLSQDTFVRLLRRPDSATPEQPRAFLATIAHGLLVDHRRRQALERAWLKEIAALPRDQVPSAEQTAEAVDLLAWIDRLLDGVRPRARSAFLLSRLDGISHPRIAERLGVSLSTVEKDIAGVLRHCYRMLLTG